jgi:hypothetical protein
MRAAGNTAMRSTPELALVVHVPASEIGRVVPVPLERLDPFTEPEPSRGATIELANGRQLVVIYGEVTGRLSVHAGLDSQEAIDDFLRETHLPDSAVIWRRPRVRIEVG